MADEEEQQSPVVEQVKPVTDEEPVKKKAKRMMTPEKLEQLAKAREKAALVRKENARLRRETTQLNNSVEHVEEPRQVIEEPTIKPETVIQTVPVPTKIDEPIVSHTTEDTQEQPSTPTKPVRLTLHDMQRNKWMAQQNERKLKKHPFSNIKENSLTKADLELLFS